MDSMRAAGLSHFVAVSGSNVVLYLAVIAAITLPLGINPKTRAALGLVSLPIFVVATRFEPSVLRATAMAGLVLIGRLVGMALEVWQVVGLGVTILLIWDPWLISSVGFQLSVAATSGVIAGARWPIAGGRVVRALLVTMGAQIAVAPLLLIHFGGVPLMSPLTNLICAPMVTLATLLAVPALLGFVPVLVPAGAIAGLVIDIADVAAAWPQLGPVEFSGFALLVGIVAMASRSRREVVAVFAAVVVVYSVAPLSRVGLLPGQVAVLDVGQGDSILLSGGNSRYVLVDGGPDPVLLMDHLRSYRIQRLEVVVLSHVHADHATGLQALFGRVSIGEIWMTVAPHETAASKQLVNLATQYGVPIRAVGPGDSLNLGVLDLDVVAPLRRYASPNDQSIVVEVEGDRRTMLLTGDIEVFAQTELPGLHADILKVPHQGAATSDADWLESVGAETAIISVGPNNFGHPAGWVVDLLVNTGAEVLRTDLDGTVIVDLG
jgi:competence protein ComEC